MLWCDINLFLEGQAFAKFDAKQKATCYLPADKVIIDAPI